MSKKLYDVWGYVRVPFVFAVEAESEEEARKEAEDMYESNELDERIQVASNEECEFVITEIEFLE